MLKKTLKKLLAVTLTAVTLVTSAMPVSASTLTPKKSHSEAQITEYVEYFNDITDKYTFRPDGYVPVRMRGTHDSQAYDSWQMTKLLQNTPGITSEQKADMKKAASKWKKSYMSERMIRCAYWKEWSKAYNYVLNRDDYTSKSWASIYKAKAKKSYNAVNVYVTKYAKLNPKLASELKKYNKQRLNVYNKAIDNWFFKMTKSQKAKYGSSVCGGGANAKPQPLFSFYIKSLFSKSKMSADPWYMYGQQSCSVAVDDYGDKYQYSTKTLHLWGYDLSKNSPNRIWNEHIQWKKW